VPISLQASLATYISSHKKDGKLEWIGVVPPYADISQVKPYFSTISGIGSVKVTLFMVVSQTLDTVCIATYLLEVEKQAIPVPLDLAIGELGISDLCPSIIVMS
jgi:hypothetical protein